MDRYILGDICFCWESDGYEVAKGEYFERFRWEEPWNGESFFFQGRVESLEGYADCPKLASHMVYDLHRVGEEHLLLYHWGRQKACFGVWPDRICSDGVSVCSFDPRLLGEAPLNADWFFGVSGLHHALLQREALVLHASYIDFQGKGILFSAPSQTGKSTQAELWRRYAGAEIINGDRVLLRKREGRWHAYGFPCCGSSQICVNRTLPVQAIVILEQAAENEVCGMSAAERIRSLVAATEVYRWDAWEVEQAFRFAEDISAQVPVLRLRCRPDEEAVQVLREALE